MTLLTFDQLTFRYPRTRRPVLHDLSWEAPPGRTVLLGPNGAGKSTLLALGADALRPTAGQIRYRALNPARRADRAAYRRAVGWMPQHIRAVPGLTAQEQVAYAAWLKGLRQRQAWTAAAQALDWVSLTDVMNRKTSALSGGQLRRVGLAQVLVHAAEVLLLDEPTVGLDPAQRARFRDLLAALPSDQPVVVSTHQVDDLSTLFDTVVVMDQGLITFRGSVAAFLDLAAAAPDERRAEAAYAQLVTEER
ncbi:MAG: ATP-binding cassette domain-containing protein [Chloroflexales bacterium]|nr:ATP-binding cassette domain-containing protein [Chloroflexales bacterium]